MVAVLMGPFSWVFAFIAVVDRVQVGDPCMLDAMGPAIPQIYAGRFLAWVCLFA